MYEDDEDPYEQVEEEDFDSVSELEVETIKNTKLNTYIGLDSWSSVNEDEVTIKEKDRNILNLRNKYSSDKIAEHVSPIGPSLANSIPEHEWESGGENQARGAEGVPSSSSLSTTLSDILPAPGEDRQTKRVHFVSSNSCV